MSKDADKHGIDVEAMRKPVTQQDINEAKEALGITMCLLLKPYGEGTRVGDKAFYANFLQNMNVQITNKLPGGKYLDSAGVSITGRVNLYVNPHFYLGLSEGERIELLIHEIEHIVYLHPLDTKNRMTEDSDSSKANVAELTNVAQDAVINIPLTELTERLGVTIDRLNEYLAKYGSKTKITPQDNSAEIYWKLREFQEEMGDKLPKGFGEGEGGEIDDHSTWEESDANEEMLKATVKEAVNKAVEQTGAGNLPNHIAKQVNELNKSLVDWKRQLQQFAVRTVKFARERTRSKRNRRTGILFAGSRKEPKVKLALIGDESGSMSDQSVTQFYSEIDKIASMGVEILYIPMDAEAGEVIVYKKGTKLARTRCGGTVYQSGLNKAKELKVDGIIVFGDMDAADTPTDPKIPLLWAIFGNQEPPASFGKRITVTESR